MGRKKLPMKKIDDHSGRVIRYSKRKDGMVKKASELSILCDAEIGLLMFSPTGRLTSFASNGRIEDIFLRYVDCPADLQGGRVDNEEYLIQRLMHLNFEHKMLDKIMKMEDLEEKLQELDQQKLKAQEKMRSYNLDADSITSVHDAQAIEKTLVEAIQRVEQLKEKLLATTEAPREHETIKVLDTDVKDADMGVEVSANASNFRNSSGVQEASPPIGPHLSIDFLKEQRYWNLQSGGQTSMTYDLNI
ncbi:AGAMOUS-like 66 isoform 4 [Tripterygium wilfordii]|uniref:AGAMOUS-like 66 isoform 4 n=1 Tax=Tripterygium wilfordii TaxID=458696 RepID=A0A7J7BX26_TRIWF|nr:agamous-like MADS-box protein AGL66 [Tripterygium wilfordii]XP_038692657.1 agamous-like MADS-box protein AGL66 [Tripterygium wilfordii]KAF5726433.1 AGAMOUS-like 66 isoform 4 [Tripterygium wilfordii]